MRAYAYLVDHPDRADTARVCAECCLFPNRCDHLPARVIRLVVLSSFLLCLAPSVAQAEPLILPTGAFLAAQAMDLHSTDYAIDSGYGREGMPWMQGSNARRIVIKSAVSAGVVYLAHELSRRGKRKQARIMLYSFAAGTAAIAARNYRIGGTP